VSTRGTVSAAAVWTSVFAFGTSWQYLDVCVLVDTDEKWPFPCDNSVRIPLRPSVEDVDEKSYPRRRRMLIPRTSRPLILTLVVGRRAYAVACVDKPTPVSDTAGVGRCGMVPEFGAIRQWGDAPGIISQTAWHAPTRAAPPTRGPDESLNVLAISGGAANGSFAAGCSPAGRKRVHDRNFHVVSGVSVGALEAPFAFLGPTYGHGLLRAPYSPRLATVDFLREKPGLSPISVDSLASAQPLAALINEFVDEPLVRAIAAEHRQGPPSFRGHHARLRGRPMIWDVGPLPPAANRGLSI